MVPVCWLHAPRPMLLAVRVWGLAEGGTCRHLNFLLELTLASGVTGSVPSPGIPLTRDGEMGSGAVMMRPLRAQRAGLAAPGMAVQSGAQDWAQGQAMSRSLQLVGHGCYFLDEKTKAW